MSNKNLLERLRRKKKDGEYLKPHFIVPPKPPPDLRTPEEKKRDKLLAKKKEEEDAIKLIEESKERIFNLSFDQQDWEHDWNLEEYQKNRIERYDNEYPCDESYQGVAQWCICYKCRPEWHSQPGGVIYKSREENRERNESFRMAKEDSEREIKRLKLKKEEENRRRMDRRRIKQEIIAREKREKEEKEKEELKKKMIEQEKEYRIIMIKEKDKERDKIYESNGWKKNISKKNGKVYWTNSENKSKWDKDMNIEYDQWIEFYSYNYSKPYWYNHKTKEKSWSKKIS